jgi:hypothetical protein
LCIRRFDKKYLIKKFGEKMFYLKQIMILCLCLSCFILLAFNMDGGCCFSSSSSDDGVEKGKVKEEAEAEVVEHCFICLKETRFTYNHPEGNRWKICDACYGSCQTLRRIIKHPYRPIVQSPGYTVLAGDGLYSPRPHRRKAHPPASAVAVRTPLLPPKPHGTNAAVRLSEEVSRKLDHLVRFINNFKVNMEKMLEHFLPKDINIGSGFPNTILALRRFIDSLDGVTPSDTQLYLGFYPLMGLIQEAIDDSNPSFRRPTTNHYAFAQTSIIPSLLYVFTNRIRFIMMLDECLAPKLLTIFQSEQHPTDATGTNYKKIFLASSDEDFEAYSITVFDEHGLGWPGFRTREDAEWYSDQMFSPHNRIYEFVTADDTDFVVGYVVGFLDPTGEAYLIPPPVAGRL